MSVNGPLTHTVEDAALFLDVTSDKSMPGPEGGLVGAVSRLPSRLRIALSTKVPPTVTAHGDAEQREAVHQAGAVLRALGHQVVVRDFDYPVKLVYGHVLPRFFRGIHDDVRALPHPERLDSRTRGMARIGSLFSDKRIAKIRAGEADIAARMNSIFADVDVVITPGTATGPSRVGAYRKLGGVATLALIAGRIPYLAAFNATGQPAAVVPWGLDRNGIPLSIQLVGRPFDEATLLSLCAEIEADHPWALRRPPVS